MTLFVTRICTQLVPRLTSRTFHSWKQKAVIGYTNKYVQLPFSCFKPRWMSSQSDADEEVELGEEVKFYFKMSKTGEIVEAIAREGQTVMNVAEACSVDMEGACEGNLACTTCHVYVEEDLFDRLPVPETQEEDLLDSSPFLKLTSRLSCQLTVTKDMEGAVFTVPPGTQNMQVDKEYKKKN